MRAARVLAFAAALCGSAGAVTTNVTFYHASLPGQSACGPTLGAWKQIAVSRDLRYRFPCGARVRVTLKTPKGGVRTFVAVANDRMPAGTPAQTIDILVQRHARLYGRTVATVVRLED